MRAGYNTIYADQDKEPTYLRIIDEEAAPLVGFIPDYHDDPASLEALTDELHKAAPGKKKHIILGDPTDKTQVIKFIKKYGFKDGQAVQLDYLAQHVLTSSQEKDIFMTVQTIEQYGGVDQYLQLIRQQQPNLDVQQQKEALKQYYEQYAALGIDEKLKRITSAQQAEMSKQSFEAQVNLRALDLAFTQYYATNLTQKIKELDDKYEGEFVYLYDKGNHATTLDVQMIKQLLDKQDIFYDIDEIGGTIKLGKGNDQLKFQAASNIYGIGHQSDGMTYSPKELEFLYPHMHAMQTVAQDIYKEKDITDKAKQSREYQRIRFASEDDILDTLYLHSNLGDPLGYKGRSLYPALDDYGIYEIARNYVRKYGEFENLPFIQSGHIHHKKQGVDEDYGVYKSEVPVSYTLKKDGELQHVVLDHEKQEAKIDEQRILELFEQKRKQILEIYQRQQKQQDTGADQQESYRQAA